MSKKDIDKLLLEIAKPITNLFEFELVDAEFVKEANNWYVRIYIDKTEGITIDDCEKVSKAISKELDNKDPIPHQYILEVSSPGLDRPLKKDSDFIKYKGREVEVKLFKPQMGKKIYEGELLGLIENKIVINSDGNRLEFLKNDVSIIRLAVKF